MYKLKIGSLLKFREEYYKDTWGIYLGNDKVCVLKGEIKGYIRNPIIDYTTSGIEQMIKLYWIVLS